MTKHRRITPKETGFTIIEMMIATIVFSMLLLLCATAIVQVGRQFYKGVIINRTQDTARKAVDDISQAIQFGAQSNNFFRPGSATYNSIIVNSYCLGAIRYSFAPISRSRGTDAAEQIAHVMWKDHIDPLAACMPLDITQADPGGISGQELVGDAMRLPLFLVTQPTDSLTGLPDPTGIWNIQLTVAYGATNDLFTDASDTVCIGINTGGQFCAVSAINTNAIKRL